MLLRIYLSLFFCGCFLALSAQNEMAILKGTVKDWATGEELLGANVLVLDAMGKVIQATAADLDGAYRLEIAVGTYTVRATYIGFETYERKALQLKAGAQVLDISMIAAVSSLHEAQVAKKPLFGGKNRAKGNINFEKMPKPGPEPLDTDNESYAASEESPFLSPWQKPLSTFSIDVDNASYSNTRRLIREKQAIPKDAVRIEEFINYFNYSYEAPTEAKETFRIYTERSDCPWNENHQLLKVAIKGRLLPKAEQPPSNLVFLLDVSGSMSNSNKLPLLKKTFSKMMDALNKNDRIAIVVYAGASGLILPSTPIAQKTKILNSLNSLNAGGSTAGGAGIKLAYRIAQRNLLANGNNRIILATDGDFNVGVSSSGGLKRLIERKRDLGICLTVVGFGMGNYKDDNLETLAQYGNGNYAYIDNIQEAEKFFVRELSSNLFAIAKDVKLQLEFNPRTVSAYRLIGYDNRRLADEDFNDDAKDAGELGPEHSVTALYEIVLSNKKTEQLASIDSLRYQAPATLAEKAHTDELLFLKLRHKLPHNDVSRLSTQAVSDPKVKLAESSDNFRFAAAVAAFGLLLKDSPHKGAVDIDMILSLAQKAKGADEQGYRAEFIELVQLYSQQQPVAED